MYRGPTFRARVPITPASSLPGTQPRNIVLLLDGTGKQYGDKYSNLIKLHTVLMADESQLLYYASGPGEFRSRAEAGVFVAPIWKGSESQPLHRRSYHAAG
jgi:uncharacterized protein (DUF2235 family)